MYILVYTRGYKLPKEQDFVILANGVRFPTVKDASSSRKWSGDLVVDEKTLAIAQSDVWLFEWEKQDETCYVREMQKLSEKLT